MNNKLVRDTILLLFAVLVSVESANLASAQTQQLAQTITAEELKNKLQRNEQVAVVDVRSTSSYITSENRIRGAIHVKLRRLKSRLSLPPLRDLPRDREIVTYCACPSDEASIIAARVLADAGFKRVRVLRGGWVSWLQAKGQVEPRPVKK